MKGEESENHQSQREQESKSIDLPVCYMPSEVYSIRKESINSANEQIYRKLSKSFQRIKRIREEPNSSELIRSQFDYERSTVRKDFKRCREIYNTVSKANLIVKRRIDKVRSKIERLKNEVKSNEILSVQEIDMKKLYKYSQKSSSSQAAVRIE